MSRSFLLVLSLVFLVGVVGCGSEKHVEPANHESLSHDEHATHEKTEVSDAFADMAPTDREAAIAQKTCPVSDQELGSMGTPIKVVVEGREVFVCCQGCVDELKKTLKSMSLNSISPTVIECVRQLEETYRTSASMAVLIAHEKLLAIEV